MKNRWPARKTRFIDSVTMPPRPLAIVGGTVCVLVALFALLQALGIRPLNVTVIYYINTIIVYGIWVGFILFFMLHSLRRPTSFPSCAPHTRFVCLVPAYNEAPVISNSVGSLLAQDYPKMLFEVVMVFDGMDNTGEVAAEMGAFVIKTPKPRSGKHSALGYAFQRLLKPNDERYVVVFDADTVVDANFLQRMNDAIESGGFRCLQGFHDVLNNDANWVTKALWCATAASSRLYNQGRFQSVGNALVCGTGWCCQGGLVHEYWPRLRTQTEDIELNGILLLHEGVRVAWVSDARFYDEKPLNLWVAAQQRRRWMTGHIRTFGLLAWPCLKAGFRRRDAALAEIALYYAVPIAMSIGIVQLFIVHTGVSVGVFWVGGPLATVTAQLALSIVTVAYVLIYQMIGFGIMNGRWGRGVLYALYTVAFSLIAWTMGLVWAWFSLLHRDWMYNTPHITQVAPVREKVLKAVGERA